MRILHVLDHSLPLQSGYVYRTLGIVKQQRAMGWEPVLLTSGKHYAPGPSREQIGEWEFLRTPRRSGLGAKLPGLSDLQIVVDLRKRLDEVVREVKPHLLHAHSPVLNGVPAVFVGRRHRLPVVYEVRALWEDAWVSAGHRSASLRYWATRQMETFMLHHSDAIVVICQGLSDDLVARGIPKGKISIVPNAVDREVFVSPRSPDLGLALELGLHNKTVIGFFGSFYRYEGLHLLLEALPELRRRCPDIAVLMAGGGPEEARLQRLAKNLHVSSEVVFAGRVPHQTIQRYYELADILLFPRLSMRLTELVTPLKPLEAMAQGRIVVASDVGGHRELIRDQETGYLFRPDDSGELIRGVMRALHDREAWPAIRARATRYIETEKTWVDSVARYAKVYRGLVSIS